MAMDRVCGSITTVRSNVVVRDWRVRTRTRYCVAMSQRMNPKVPERAIADMAIVRLVAMLLAEVRKLLAEAKNMRASGFVSILDGRVGWMMVVVLRFWWLGGGRYLTRLGNDMNSDGNAALSFRSDREKPAQSDYV